MRIILKSFLYLFVGLVSLLFFIYLTFPYQVLKERMVNRLSQETKSLVSIRTLEPDFPFGLSLNDIRVYHPGVGEVNIKKLGANISFFSLLLGSIQAQLNVYDSSQGLIQLDATINLRSLISDPSQAMPSYVGLMAQDFEFGSLVNYIISSKAGEKDLNPMVKSALRDVKVVGKLKSNSFFHLDSNDYLKSKGSIDITLVNAGLDLLSLPFQDFKQANIKASLDKGAFDLDPTTKLVSEGLKFEASGNIKQQEDPMKSKLDLVFKVELFKALKENFGMILDIAAKKTTEGSMKIKLKGTLDKVKTDIF